MIELGQKVRDVVTGFEGVATSRVEYLNGCVQYAVAPVVNEKDPQKLPDSVYFDVQRLEVVDDGMLARFKKAITPAGRVASVGGPQRDEPRGDYRG